MIIISTSFHSLCSVGTRQESHALAPLKFIFLISLSSFTFFFQFNLCTIETQARTCDLLYLLFYMLCIPQHVHTLMHFFGSQKMIHSWCLFCVKLYSLRVAWSLAFAAYYSVSSSNNITHVYVYGQNMHLSFQLLFHLGTLYLIFFLFINFISIRQSTCLIILIYFPCV